MGARPTFSGTVGPFGVKPLRNLIEKMKFNGHEIELWIGHGFLRKPFSVKGAPGSVDTVRLTVEAWMQEDGNGS